jgi:hypothetical protein
MAKNAGRSGRRWKRLKAEVYARRAPCCRCGQPIDYALPYLGLDGRPNPDAKSVDHYPYPLSTHPWLAEDPANLAGCHLRCNVRAQTSTAALAGTPSEAW